MGDIANEGSSAGKKVCISCQNDVTGRRAVPVKEDRIIRILRSLKKSFGVLRGNQLFVCEACVPKHNDRRRSFEKTLLFASVIAGIMLLLLILVPLWSGRFEPFAFVSGILVAGIIVLIPILFKYVPAVEVAAASTLYTGAARVPPPYQPYPRAPPSPPQPPAQPAAQRQAAEKPPQKEAPARAEKPKAPPKRTKKK